jgi:hypothetical protein
MNPALVYRLGQARLAELHREARRVALARAALRAAQGADRMPAS